MEKKVITFKVHVSRRAGGQHMLTLHPLDPQEFEKVKAQGRAKNELMQTSQSGKAKLNIVVDQPDALNFLQYDDIVEVTLTKV